MFFICPVCRREYALDIAEPITTQKVDIWFDNFVCKCGYNDKAEWREEVRKLKDSVRQGREEK